jgi:KDO2-lipid IV(A) lauroyltransferase
MIYAKAYKSTRDVAVRERPPLDSPALPGDTAGRQGPVAKIGQQIAYIFQPPASPSALPWCAAARRLGLGARRVYRAQLWAAPWRQQGRPAQSGGRFPEKTPAETEKGRRGGWDNLGRTGAEYSQLDRIFDTSEDGPISGGRIQVEGVEHFVGLREDNKPALLFTAHCGNWELLPIGAVRHGLPVVIFFRPPNNPFAAQLVRRIRRRTMGRMLPSGLLGTIAAREALSQGEHLGMLVDQHHGLGQPIPFFGRPARTALTLAKFARQFRCPVHGAFVERLGGARFRMTLLPALDLVWTEDAEADYRAAMTQVNKTIEDWVRAHPDQWLWLHRRWR